MSNLEAQAKEALLMLIGEINKPSVVCGQHGDEWTEIYSQLTSALDIVLKLEANNDG